MFFAPRQSFRLLKSVFSFPAPFVFLVGLPGVPAAARGGLFDGGPSRPEKGSGRFFDDMVSEQELRPGHGLRAFA